MNIQPNFITRNIASYKNQQKINTENISQVSCSQPVNLDKVDYRYNSSFITFKRQSKHVDLKELHLLKSCPKTISLISTPNASFSKDLEIYTEKNNLRIKDKDLSSKRIASLSTYLKENMIGFTVPKYEVRILEDKSKEPKSIYEKKGGYPWMERGLKNLIKGTNKAVTEENYVTPAKQLFGLLATHDNYWKSQDFIKYLATLKQSNAVKSTIQAVKQLKKENKNISFGYSESSNKTYLMRTNLASPFKLENKVRGAYSGNKLGKSDMPEYRLSLEHIVPAHWGGAYDDSNYLMTSSKENSNRGNIGLIDFLLGNNED